MLQESDSIVVYVCVLCIALFLQWRTRNYDRGKGNFMQLSSVLACHAMENCLEFRLKTQFPLFQVRIAVNLTLKTGPPIVKYSGQITDSQSIVVNFISCWPKWPNFFWLGQNSNQNTIMKNCPRFWSVSVNFSISAILALLGQIRSKILFYLKKN